MSTKHSTGDQVYLDDGQVVEFIADIGDGVVVRPIYESDDEEPRFGRPFTVSTVHAQAPIAKWSEEVQRLRIEAGELREKISEARAEWATFEREESARRQRLKMHAHLERLDTFLAGKVTHVLQISYDRFEVADIETAAKDREYSRDLRLITLRGQLAREGEARWSIDDRSDNIIPCTSREEAVATAERMIAERFVLARKDQHRQVSTGALMDSCKRLGLTPPADFAEQFRAMFEKQAADEVAKAEEALQRARAKLAAVPKAAEVAS